MKDEIKEILDILKRLNNEYSLNSILDFEEHEISNMQLKQLLDYITNLQREIRTNNDLIPYFKNRVKELKKEITNLQEEKDKYKHKFWEEQEQNEYLQDRIKELEQINEEHRELNGSLRTANSTLCEVEDFMYNQAKEYKTRIDKATEVLESMLPICIMPNNTLIHGTEKAKTIEKAINILQGSDNSE